MEKIDRLFGKEITNILDAGYLANHRNYQRVSCKNRALSIDQPKRQNIKVGTSVSHRQQPEPSDPLHDPQCVPTYFQQCLRFMMHQESKTHNIYNYMENQEEINQNMRGILLDWLIDLHLKFKLFSQTIFTIVTIIDRYLMKKSVPKIKLQLVGVAAFFIAAKYEQTYQVPELRDLVHLTARAYTKEQILEMEADIINVLDFNLIVDSTYKFFIPFTKLTKLEPKNVHLAQYVLQLSLFDMKFLNYTPSLMAASAIYLINKIRKRTPAWSDLMIAATGYEQSQLKVCARQLCFLLQNAQNTSNTKSLRRKFSLISYHQVTKIKLERRQRSKN